MLRMLWITESFYHCSVSVRAASILRWRGSVSADQARRPIGPGLRRHRENPFDPDIVFPIVAEVVDIDELRTGAQPEVTKPSNRRVLRRMLGFRIRGFEATLAHLESVEVVVEPTEDYL
jgi:hypothetical protein